MAADWKETNRRERHLRIGGRIVGKIQRQPKMSHWQCFVRVRSGQVDPNGRLVYIAQFFWEDIARKFVEATVEEYPKVADKLPI